MALAIIGLPVLGKEEYHADDKEGLRIFLRQPSAEAGKINAERLGLQIHDTLNWQNDEAWVSKVLNLTWNEETPKRLIRISDGTHPAGWWFKGIAGNLDASKWSKLTILKCDDNKLTSLNVSANTILTELVCHYNYFSLSELFTISEMLENNGVNISNRKLGSQTMPAQTVDVGVELDFPVPQNLFNGIYTDFTVTQYGDPAPKGSFTVTNGKITFHTVGVFTVEMTNEAILSSESAPARVVFNVSVGDIGDLFVLESRYFLWKCGTEPLIDNISPENFVLLMSNLDLAYEAMQELTGFTPENGKQVNIELLAEDDWAGGRGGGGYIGINPAGIGHYMREVERDSGAPNGLLLHELGHNFDWDTGGRWYNAEIGATVLAYYAREKLNLLCHHDYAGEAFLGSDWIDLEYTLITDRYNRGETTKNDYENDFMVCLMKLFHETNWEPLKAVYHNYSDRFIMWDFIDWLSRFSDIPVDTYFYPDLNEWLREIYKDEWESTTEIEHVESSNVAVFPNPAKEEIFIKSESQIMKVEIYSLAGSLMLSETNFNGKISVSALPKGIYMIRVYADNGLEIGKIVKE